MKKLLFIALMMASAMMASAFENQYRIVAKIVNGQEKPLSGLITLAGNQSYAGNVEYNKLTIFINDMINYEWSIFRKYILDETSVQLHDYSGHEMTVTQINDSVYKFTLPLFYGSQKGDVVYKTIAISNAEKEDRVARAEDYARKAAEAAARAKKAEEDTRKAKAQSQLAGLFGSGSGTGTGSTNTAGSGSAATRNPIGSGSGNSNGASWSLAGRGLSGSLSKPSYRSNAEGTVVVAIRVDQNGNVVSAVKGAGTNTNDQTLINAAIEAAKKAKFTAGDGVAIGSITYVFRLN